MKKILSLLVLMATFCVIGFAQSAPKTAKKAMLMGDNAQVKDLKTGQVLRVAKASKQVPAINGTIQMSKNGVSTPSNSTPINGSGVKKAVKGNPATIKLTESFPNQIQRKATNTSIRKQKTTALQNIGIATMQNSLGKKQERTPQNNGVKQKISVPQNAVILEKQ